MRLRHRMPFTGAAFGGPVFPGGEDPTAAWRSTKPQEIGTLYCDVYMDPHKPPVQRRFVCDECGLSYNRKDNLARHKRVHEGKYFGCHHCDKKYTYRHDLKKHCESVHTDLMPDCEECMMMVERSHKFQKGGPP